MAGFPARERDAFQAHWEKIRGDESNLLRTIVFGDQVVGNVVSFMMDGERQVGYWIGRAFWGRGIATRALGLLLAETEDRPLYAFAAKQNHASARVLEKCGFVRREIEADGEVGFVLR